MIFHAQEILESTLIVFLLTSDENSEGKKPASPKKTSFREGWIRINY